LFEFSINKALNTFLWLSAEKQYVTVPSNKIQIFLDSQTRIYLQSHLKKSYSLEKFKTLLLRQLHQCRLQSIRNSGIANDVNDLQLERRTLLPSLPGKDWRCSAGRLGGKGRREVASHTALSPWMGLVQVTDL